MSAPELKPCPFCGGDPWFDKPQAYDDRRYMAMHLECCVKLRATLGYSKYRNMRPEDIEAALKKELVAAWNTRADLPPTDAQIMAHPLMVELLNEARGIARAHDTGQVSWNNFRSTLEKLRKIK